MLIGLLGTITACGTDHTNDASRSNKHADSSNVTKRSDFASSAANSDVYGMVLSTLNVDSGSDMADLNQQIANSYPAPTLETTTQHYSLQPDYRFEQWVLAAMVQDPDTLSWRWQENRFVRLGVKVLSGSNEPVDESNSSAWDFNAIVGHQSTSYDFSSERSNTSVEVDRQALGFADATERTLSIGNTQLRVTGGGCVSELSVDEQLSENQPVVWEVNDCVEHVKISDTVVASNSANVRNGVGWVNHSFGQLPNLAGAVFIERAVVQVGPDEQLIVDRSRRRSGNGPVTVSGAIKRNGVTQSLRGVQWQETVKPASRFPDSITITAEGLSQSWQLRVPAEVLNERAESPAGQQHGVLAAPSASDNGEPRPGMVTLYPRNAVGT